MRSTLPEKKDQHEQMNLTISSSASNQSKADVAESPAIVRSRAKRQAGKDLDSSLKLQVASALSASGYYSRVNVLISATSSRGLADVTDIDVLAIRYDPMFKRDAVAVSCKSGGSKTLSPAREAF